MPSAAAAARVAPQLGRLLGGLGALLRGSRVAKVGLGAVAADVAVLPAIERVTEGRFTAPDITARLASATANSLGLLGGASQAELAFGTAEGITDSIGHRLGLDPQGGGIAPVVLVGGGLLVLFLLMRK